jgi:hypothetical protein
MIKRLKRTAVSMRIYRKNFFRKRHYPSEATMQLLKDLYPRIDWKRVHFYEGLPWFTPPVAPYVTAQALPRSYSLGGFSIYLKQYDEERAQCLADIIHEAFHVMQAMTYGRGYGAGFTRIWMIYYLAEFMRVGYRKNPFEIPAYNQEFRFLSYCARRGIRGILSRVGPGAFADISGETELVHHRSDYKFRGPRVLIVAAFFLCITVSVLKPFADVMVYFIGSYFKKKANIKSGKTRDDPHHRHAA